MAPPPPLPELFEKLELAAVILLLKPAQYTAPPDWAMLDEKVDS